ncbi:MAG: hypothetical protein JW893_05535 [Candidatus Omnitrophica bacterium]|nr:hypothetical protein [Candidatus Omnitrophota bacterium]
MKKDEMIEKNLKRSLIGMTILMTALAVFQNPVQAEMIRGEVVAVKDDGSSFGFKRAVPSELSIPEQFDIAVLANTKFEKISSLKELRAGDEVVVDVAQRKNGTWEADSVRIFKVRLYKE